MRKLNKKQRKNLTYVSIALLIGILAYFGFFNTFSILEIPHIGLQEKTFTFDGISGVAKSTYFGSTTNSEVISSQVGNGGVGEGFCGNDGDVRISNSLSDGGSLVLSSSMTQTKKTCATNGIIIENLTLPAGKLTINCVVSASESDSGADQTSSAGCKVGSVGTSAWQNGECVKGQDKINANYWESNCAHSSDSKTFELNFDKETTIEVLVTSKAGYTGSASSRLTLNFEPKVTESLTSYYEFSENSCVLISKLPSEKLESDYETLEECQNQITSDGGNEETPSTTSPLVIIFSVGGGIALIWFLIWLYRKK